MKHCATGKAGHTTLNRLIAAAHETHRELNRRGEIVKDFYGYKCPTCRQYHLTRREKWGEEENMLILVAAPRDLQEWAITGIRPTVGQSDG